MSKKLMTGHVKHIFRRSKIVVIGMEVIFRVIAFLSGLR
jgi:hypothetical protein